MSIFYHIRPKNNGMVKLGKTNSGEFVEIPKGTDDFDNQILLFETEDKAQEYIDIHLSDEYMTEWTWRSNKFVCPSCGAPLQVNCVVSSDESVSGNTERICSCQNYHCLADWNLITDENDNIIKIERYFVG